MAPSDVPGPPTTVALAAAKSPRTQPGVYTLNFMDYTRQIVTTLPVLSRELILNLHVVDANGQLAQDGTAVFEYCSYRGLPPNDIDRADEAPSSACAAGTAMWKTLWSVSISNGDGYLNFGIVRIPRTVGFRARYRNSKTISPWTTDPRDFTWTAQ